VEWFRTKNGKALGGGNTDFYVSAEAEEWAYEGTFLGGSERGGLARRPAEESCQGINQAELRPLKLMRRTTKYNTSP